MPAARPKWVKPVMGVLAALAVAGVVRAISAYVVQVPNPGFFFFLTIVVCAFAGGFATAVSAAVVFGVALAEFYSEPGRPFRFDTEGAYRAVTGATSMLVTAVIVGRLKARADGRLAASEARFEALFHALPHAVLVCRHDQVVFANRYAAWLFRTGTPDAMRGTPVWRLIDPAYHAGVQTYLEDLGRGVEPDRPFEHTAVAFDGATFDAEAVSVEFPAGAERGGDAAGAVRLVVVRDISVRQRLARRVDDQLRDLSLLHEVSRALLGGLKPVEIPEYVCSLIVDRLGARTACMGDVCHPGPRVQLTVTRGAAGPPRDDRNGDGRHADPAALAIAGARPVVCADAASDVRAEGWRPWVEACGCSSVASFPLINAGQVIAVLNVCASDGYFTDERSALIASLANLAAIALAEAQASEAVRRRAADLQLALDAGQMGVFDWDMADDRLVWDANHLRLFGITAEQFGGTFEAFGRCVHPDDWPELEWAMHAARQARAAYEQEFRVVWPDGGVHWVIARGQFSFDGSGRAVRMTGFVLDIDRRHKAEETAREQRDQLAHLLRLNLLNQLASGLAHEINQPLTAITNFAGAALEMQRGNVLTPARTQEVLTEIHQQSQRAGDIVRRLRGFMAKRPGHVKDCDLTAVVADAVAFMEAEVAQKRVRVKVEPAEGLPPVRVDPVQVQQVLVNLIQNAIDAMDETPTRDRQVTVSTVGSDEQVIVRVADTGKGIKPADLPRLFDSFFSTKSYGMGLGLNISRSIIEGHGGHLTAANNADGRGATFEFLLPLEGYS